MKEQRGWPSNQESQQWVAPEKGRPTTEYLGLLILEEEMIIFGMPAKEYFKEKFTFETLVGLLVAFVPLVLGVFLIVFLIVSAELIGNGALYSFRDWLVGLLLSF